MFRPSNRAVAILSALALIAGVCVAHAAPPAAEEAKAPVQAEAKTPAQAEVLTPAPAGVAGAAAAGGLLVPGSEFRYDSTGRRDPFKSLLQLEKKQRDVSELPPIQRFDVEQAAVVGIIVDPGRDTQAMVRAPGGQSFVVRVGTIIGKNEGEVVEITLNGIRIIEKFLDFMNRETRKETFLKSHPAAGK